MTTHWRLHLAFMLAPTAAFGAGFGSQARGTTGAEFLNIGVGARATAMGEAFSSAADDATAIYWNPAGLARIDSKSAALMHASYPGSGFFNYAAYGQRLGKTAAVGASVQYFSSEKIAETDVAGAELGSFKPNDLAISAAGAYVLKGLSFGVSIKYIRTQILTSAQTTALDLGILSPALFSDRFRVGAVVTNLGDRLRYEQQPEELPTTVRFGSSLQMTERWLAAADLGIPRNDSAYFALGTEYAVPAGKDWRVFGRTGFNSRTVGDIDGFTGISFGSGVGYNRMTVDYALVPFGELGLAHRFSLSFRL